MGQKQVSNDLFNWAKRFVIFCNKRGKAERSVIRRFVRLLPPSNVKCHGRLCYHWRGRYGVLDAKPRYASGLSSQPNKVIDYCSNGDNEIAKVWDCDLGFKDERHRHLCSMISTCNCPESR